MRSLARWLVLLVSVTMASTAAVASDKDVVEDQVSFQVAVERDVENDRGVVTLRVTVEDRDAARLAQQINEAMEWALDKLKGRAEIKTRSGTYQTYPVYDDRKIVRWRGSQELQLESGDIVALTQMTGVLQERLQVQSMQFLVSSAKRQEVESALTEQALSAFQQRAEVIRKALGASGYRLVDVNLNAGGLRPPMPLRAEALSVSRTAGSSPAVEAGSSSITVQVNGRIQLLRK